MQAFICRLFVDQTWVDNRHRPVGYDNGCNPKSVAVGLSANYWSVSH